MFERFTTEAREVVVQAHREARALEHCYVGAEHLVLAILTQPQAPGVPALLRLGLTPKTWRAAVEDVFGTSSGQQSRMDADALSALGIDIDQVRGRVEAAFGPGALEPPRPRRRRLLRRLPGDGPVGHIPVTDRAKRALERSLHEARALDDRHIGVEHILLGLLDPRGNMAVTVLRTLDLDPDQVRAAVLADLGRAA